MIWHSGIPEDEIWKKLGGDKRGTSFKVNFQIVNVEHPNSTENTCVFCPFEASNSLTNLYIGLERYRDQVNNLELQTWKYIAHNICIYMPSISFLRGKDIRVFLSGDYEFLTRMYGLSGASGSLRYTLVQATTTTFAFLLYVGRHCCLWCLITNNK